MSKPVSPRPLRKVAAICAYSQDDPPLRNPIIGIAVCCARAASGHDAAPPSSVMNSRRARSFEHLVSDGEQVLWNSEAKRLGGFAIDDQVKFGRLLDGASTAAFEGNPDIAPTSAKGRV
jgi:hypothetical protein